MATNYNQAPAEAPSTIPTEEELIALRLFIATRPEVIVPEMLFMGGMAVLAELDRNLE